MVSTVSISWRCETNSGEIRSFWVPMRAFPPPGADEIGLWGIEPLNLTVKWSKTATLGCEVRFRECSWGWRCREEPQHLEPAPSSSSFDWPAVNPGKEAPV